MKKLPLFLLIIVIQLGILFPPISPVKAAQCCKTHCNHKPSRPMPNHCPIQQKGDCKQRTPVECCKSRGCPTASQLEPISLKQKAASSNPLQEVSPFQPALANLLLLPPDLKPDRKKSGFSPHNYSSDPPLFIQNCSFLI